MTTTLGSHRPHTKSGRLEARLSPRLKQLFQQAADINGTTLTLFVITSAQEAARRVVQDQEIMVLNARDRKILVKALLNPPDPSFRLRSAYAHYKKSFGR